MIKNFKIFEAKGGIDPYDEENWNDEIDLSGQDLDTQVKMLNDLILNRHRPLMSEFDVDFHYSKMSYNDEEHGAGNAIDEIIDVLLGEDGDIIFIGIISVYDEKTDDYNDYDVYYTVDVNYPIYIKSTKVILK